MASRVLWAYSRIARLIVCLEVKFVNAHTFHSPDDKTLSRTLQVCNGTPGCVIETRLQTSAPRAYIAGMASVLEQHLAAWVERDPERLGGVPVFRGTRVPVKSLFDHIRGGDSLEIFLDDFPGVSREQAQAVLDAAGIRLLEDLQPQ